MKIEFSDTARKQLARLDKVIQKRIKIYLTEVSNLEDPRSRGKGLVKNLSGFWRCRVGDYRIICEIKDKELVLLALKIAHRREIYNN